MKENITVLGSTGSIGQSTLDVIARYPQRYQIFALTANDNVALLAEQCTQFEPEYAVLSDKDSAAKLRMLIGGLQTQVLAGTDALTQVVADYQVDTVIAGIVGIAGLVPTLEAARHGKRILLANKEALVVAGRLLTQTAKDNGALIIPVDSEHNGVLQCLEKKHQRVKLERVRKVILTASGGPFLRLPTADLSQVTPKQACQHPNWEMGAKISVDSATMLNKGLEVIEAYWLFDIPLERIEILVHPQSIVHALVMFEDGAVIAQLSRPDMRVAIAYALSGSQRIDSGVEPLDLTQYGQLEFQTVDHKKFPCVNLVHEAFTQGDAAIIALNAANEVAVSAFLDERLSFNQIPAIIRQTFIQISKREVPDIEAILAVDGEARSAAQDMICSIETS